MLPSNLLVTPTQAISIFLLKTTYCCIMWFIILYVKVVWKQSLRDFLLNRLNLLIFNIIFTSNLARVLGSSSLWEFILVRLQAFSLRFYWEWAPTQVFLDLCCNVQNNLFCRTPLGGSSHLSLLSGSIFLANQCVLCLLLKNWIYVFRDAFSWRLEPHRNQWTDMQKLRCKYYKSESQLVTMIMVNFMTKKKVNWIVPSTWTKVLIHQHVTK